MHDIFLVIAVNVPITILICFAVCNAYKNEVLNKMDNLKYYLRDFSSQVSWDHCCDTRMQIYDELRRLQYTYELKQGLQEDSLPIKEI